MKIIRPAYFTEFVILGVQEREKNLLLQCYARFFEKNTTKLSLAVFFPAGTTRADDLHPAERMFLYLRRVIAGASEAAKAVPKKQEQ